MSVLIVCPHCRSQLMVEPELVGQAITCGNCQQVFEARVDVAKPVTTSPPVGGPPPLPTDSSRLAESPDEPEEREDGLTRTEKDGLRSVALGLTFVNVATWSLALVVFVGVVGLVFLLGKDLAKPFTSGKFSLVANLDPKKIANVVLFGGCVYLLAALAQTAMLIGLICCWGVPKTRTFAKARSAIVFGLIFFAAALGIDVLSLMLTILLQGRKFLTEQGVHPCVTLFVAALRLLAFLQFLSFLRELVLVLRNLDLASRLGRLWWMLVGSVVVLSVVGLMLFGVALATANSKDPEFAVGALRVAIALSCTLYTLGGILGAFVFVSFLVSLKRSRRELAFVLEVPASDNVEEPESETTPPDEPDGVDFSQFR